MSRLDKLLTHVENVLAAASLGLAAVIAIAGVILRYLFNEVLFWSEEAIIYLVIFSTFLGAVITLRRGEHVNVDLVPAMLEQRGKRFFAFLGTAVLLVYLGVIGFFAWLLIFEPAARNTVTPSLKLPLWVVELALPIGFTLMTIRALQILYRLARNRPAHPDRERSIVDTEASAMGMDTREDGR